MILIMENKLAKLGKSALSLAHYLILLSVIVVPIEVNSESYVDIGDLQYRLVINPDAPAGEWAVYATLSKALTPEAAGNMVNIPDFINVDGVQYPVIDIEPSAYEGYGITKISYNKFFGPMPPNHPTQHGSGASCVQDVRIVEQQYGSTGIFAGWTKLNSIEVDYASEMCEPTQIGQSGGVYPAKLSLSAFTEQVDINGYSNTGIMEANLGFCMSTVNIGYGDFPLVTDIKCAAPVPPVVYADDFMANNKHFNLHVPIGAGTAYRNNEDWNELAYNIYEDIDYAFNPVSTYIEENGIYYGIEWDNKYLNYYATVIGPVNRECTSVDVMESVNWNGVYVPVKKISPCAFMKCENITSFSLPYGIEEIGDLAFYGCSGTYDYRDSGYSFYLPDSVKKIGKRAFAGTEVAPRMPESLKEVGDYAFSGSFKGNNYYNKNHCILMLNQSLEYIGDGAFNNGNYADSPLISIVIPSTVKHIGFAAFGFRNLADMEFKGNTLEFETVGDVVISTNTYYKPEITLPSNIISISNNSIIATSVIIGENVKYISPGGIMAEELWMLPDTPPTAYESSFTMGDKPLSEQTLHIKQERLTDYANHPVWGKFGKIIADIDWINVTQDEWTFKIDRYNKTAELTGYNGNSSGSRLSIPCEVTYNGETFPVETIGKWAISNISYDEIELPSSIKHIKNYGITYSSQHKIICQSIEPPVVDSSHPYAIEWPYKMYDCDTYLYVPQGSKAAYKESAFGKMFRDIIGNSQSDLKDITDAPKYDEDLPMQVYSISGTLIYEGVIDNIQLPTGIYLIQQGSTVYKHFVQ